MKVAILQPEVPHYREEFFALLSKKSGGADIFVYNSLESSRTGGFNVSEDMVRYIPNKNIHGIVIYNPFTLLRRNYDTLVLMLHFAHLTTWLLLMTKWLHRKKIVLWGQGISVKRYLQEEKKPDWKLKWQMAMADGVWLYMEKEKRQWERIFPRKPMVALNNTLSGVDKMVAYTPSQPIAELKKKYGIRQEVVLIFCARFENNYRRVDLLEKTIKQLDPQRYGFIIIGAGRNKPDFSPYANVYDFGAVYDTDIKRELFALADIYFQPGWVGLSIVEAMAYGKPIFTFQRTEETKQCVEYSYIEHGRNGMTFSNIEDCVSCIENISKEEIQTMGRNAREYVAKHLSVEQMVDNAMSVIKRL